MATSVDNAKIAQQARRLYVETVYKGLPGLVKSVLIGAGELRDKPSEHQTTQRRRDLVDNLNRLCTAWRSHLVTGLRQLLQHGAAIAVPAGLSAGGEFSLVDNDTIEREILTSRLALAIMDRASWEFSDLRSRLAALERRAEIDTNDMLRAHVLARLVLDAWRSAGLSAIDWREAQAVLHDEFAALCEEAYHETNHWLIGHKVMPEVDLRPYIRRATSRNIGHDASGQAAGFGTSGFDGSSFVGQAGPGQGSSSFGPEANSGYGNHSGFGARSGNGPGAQLPWQNSAANAHSGAARQTNRAGAGFGVAASSSARAGTSAGLAPSSGARSRSGLAAPSGPGAGAGAGAGSGAGRSVQPEPSEDSGYPQAAAGRAGRSDAGTVGEETRMMTRAAPLARGSDHADAVLGRLNRLVGRHLPGFSDTAQARPLSGTLAQAINNAQQNLRRRFANQAEPASSPEGGLQSGAATLPAEPTVLMSGSSAAAGRPLPQALTGPMLLEELNKNKQALKQAANSPAERATIEIVALMFQSILTEERIPAPVRVWFARLQMPVLRVAVGEPDFFATLDHPARRLIDRMGACVMGLDSASRLVGDALEKEIKRVVQVVEAYPDTGRRVFQTVLVEFEKFLDHYFKNENEATRKGVSLAQQIEQRETLAIQYTIELRRMLNEVPVQEGVRQFLFQVWADVLATSAVRYGGQSAETKTMKRAAADLIWSAGAKVTREERAEVIRRLPPLLKRLREGMASAKMNAERQEERISALNSALAAAFTAKAAVISDERLQDLMERLDSLEELLPSADDIEIDESVVLDLSGHESSELEVVSEGGTLPTAPMLAWARELLIGSWYTLETRGRHESVQLAWHGGRRQLSLFVTTSGRCVLFQHQRLAAYLQAGLLLPAQDEALTVKATRNALAKLDADPARLLT